MQKTVINCATGGTETVTIEAAEEIALLQAISQVGMAQEEIDAINARIAELQA